MQFQWLDKNGLIVVTLKLTDQLQCQLGMKFGGVVILEDNGWIANALVYSIMAIMMSLLLEKQSKP